MAEILILEDDRPLAQQWRRTLMNAGHSVEICAAASEALEIINTRRFDLFIVDMLIRRDGAYVPDGGMILISKMRQMHRNSEPWWRTVPILAVTGALVLPNGFDPLRRASGMGANMTLRKPVRSLTLLESVRSLLKGPGRTPNAQADDSANDGLSPA